EKSIERKKGIIGAYVNYTSEIARIIYNPDIISKNDVERFIRKIGYNPYPPDAKIESKRKGRLLVGFAFGMMVMMVYLFYLYPIFWSGHNVDIEGLDRLKYLIANYGLWFFTTPIVFYSGYPFLRGAYVSVRARTPNMDVLVALAVLSAYFYSIYATLI
ncbi:MAG: cation-translocating P-type ATPase, partial [Candidatus Korarchaeota archaeon]|nr:cation-translocating P-type ATPase [Candidatus Korarchaeota archaeon]NIU82448.1 cation-transporting P-type ATPase [Candidatus Thorarchaeota archaeon]NIW12902.1 cation-transporting P-type ATPase [Candidatus Thorarchaeota archaeon]NIW51088.1 cation-transporting P-type ATPase [Candidatus Korarchaeota archaeon]